ncbi:MAG: condensation domain-containing protein, partial [Acidimicrobiales bacterium]
RGALPPPDRARRGRRPAPPRTAAEAMLAAIWSEVLRVDVGVDDDFFELGGHSLLAAQVVARAREVFGRDLALRTLFETPTVAGLASALGPPLEEAGAVGLVALPRPPGATFPLSLPQEQMWALEAAARPPGLYNVTAVHRFPGPVDRPALEQALAFLAARHEPLRTGFAHDGPSVSQTAASSVDVVLASTDLGDVSVEEAEAELSRLVAGDDAVPFDLSRPPLFRCRLYTRGAGDGRDGPAVLSVTFDHLVCDGPSACVFLGELATAYAAFEGRRTPELPPLPVQYADFAVWQRQWATEERLQAQLDYWQRALKGLPPGPAVPFDHRPAAPARQVDVRGLVLPPAAYADLEQLAHSARTTM